MFLNRVSNFTFRFDFKINKYTRYISSIHIGDFQYVPASANEGLVWFILWESAWYVYKRTWNNIRTILVGLVAEDGNHLAAASSRLAVALYPLADWINRLAEGSYLLTAMRNLLADGKKRLAAILYLFAAASFRLAEASNRLAVGSYRLAVGEMRLK